jgi:starch-binding outer membrane protein, SusD/RagB family
MIMRYRLCALLSLTLIAAACDFTVTNPGPVNDENLNDPLAHDALVTGSEKAFSIALSLIAHQTGPVTREIRAAGLIGGGAAGHPPRIRTGILDDEETGTHWNAAQLARWTAEDALRRLRENQGGEAALASYLPAARAYLWAGFANRLLGENMCDAVIDGGSSAPYTVYLTRAEAAFTSAIAIATTLNNTALRNAATAGRASVRADLGKWPEAVVDAGLIASTFVFQALYFNTQQEQWNYLFFGNSNTPNRSSTVFGTFYDDYYTQQGDPRVRWITVPNFPFGGPAPEGQITWHPSIGQPGTKFATIDAPVNLVTGREMRLIEAEAELVAGNWPQAMTIINARRAGLGVATVQPWNATTLDEAWTAFKRERGIELYMEGRRLGDLRRWRLATRPGVDEDMTGRSLCYPIPRTEKNANPNLN